MVCVCFVCNIWIWEGLAVIVVYTSTVQVCCIRICMCWVGLYNKSQGVKESTTNNQDTKEKKPQEKAHKEKAQRSGTV